MTQPAAVRPIGIGLISVGWMGTAHTRAYTAVPGIYPELGVAPQLIMAADTAPARVEYATATLGYAEGTTDYREVLADPRIEAVRRSEIDRGTGGKFRAVVALRVPAR